MLLQPRLIKSSLNGDVIAVHKPAGLPFHSLGREEHQEGLLSLLRKSPSLLNDASVIPDRLYAVHRLDTATSGMVLFATSRHAAGLIAKAFRERRVHRFIKYYIALSGRRPAKKQGSIVGDMSPGRRGAWKLLHTSVDPAVTRFWSTSLAQVQSGLRLYLIKPETGRTHQIRVAMKSIGAAILGDELYGAAAAAQQQDRMYLHAAALRVQLPDRQWFQALDLPGAAERSICFNESGAMTSSSSSRSSSSSSNDHQENSRAKYRTSNQGSGNHTITNGKSSSDADSSIDSGANNSSSSDLSADGWLFQHPVVRKLCHELLPEELTDNYGPWLSHNKLLMSKID
eukprot:gene5587-biopygen7394